MSAVSAPRWVNPATTAATPSGPDEEVALGGGYVVTERVDVLTSRATGRTYELPETGVPRVVDGLVAEWRDDVDLRDVEEALDVRLRA